MKKLIQLTDLHLRPPGRTLLGIDPAERLRAVVRSINLNHADAAACLVTGDLADRGEPEAYALLRECLADLAVPWRLLLGNHDRRAPFAAAFPEIAPEDGFIQSTLDLGEVVCLLLDTLDEGRPGKGHLCEARFAWLDRQLERHRDRHLLVFLHHPPLSVGLVWFERMLLAEGPQLLERLHRHGRVRHLVFGHVHVNVCGNWQGLGFSGSRGTCHKILAEPAATAVDYADPGPAYDLLLVDRGAVLVHSVDPAGPAAVIAREEATADGRGRFELLRGAGLERWM